MQDKAILHYDETMIRQAVRAFLKRRVGPGFLVAIGLASACLVVLIHAGDRSWIVGMLASVLVFAVLLPAAIFVVHYRKSMRKFHAMGSPRAELAVTESTLSLSSGAGSASLPWSSVSEGWRFPAFGLLLFSEAQFVTLPLADVSPDLQGYILQRVSAAGGRIG